MNMIKLNDINKQYGVRPILQHLDFELHRGERAALVGPNGVGKSTLLRILAGVEAPDSGDVEVVTGISIGYLPQELRMDEQATVRDYVRAATGIAELEAELSNLESQLEDPNSLARYGEVQEQYEHLNGYNFDHELSVVLAGFGLGNFEHRSLKELSGGQRSKVGLASILLKGVDVLLLDEPTNNLDLPALVWLEQYLKQSAAAMLVISHDRRFLDSLVGRIYELDWHTHALTSYKGGYSSYIDWKRKEFERTKQRYEEQREEIDRLEAAAKQKKLWAARGARQTGTDNDKFGRGARRDWSARIAGQGRAIEQRLEQMEKVERPIDRPPLNIPLIPSSEQAAHTVELRDVAFEAGSFHLGPVTLTLKPGMRVAILGSNGTGKSTLLKLATGTLTPTGGTVTIGRGVIIGNLMQAHENLPPEQTLYTYVAAQIDWERHQIFHLLRSFHFEAEEADKPIKLLSPGGRARLLLAVFAARGANFLVLDEPTNHLDVEAVEALENVLQTYSGTCLIVSHDRMFLERANLTDTYLLENGVLRTIGNYTEYERSVIAEAVRLARLL